MKHNLIWDGALNKEWLEDRTGDRTIPICDTVRCQDCGKIWLGSEEPRVRHLDCPMYIDRRENLKKMGAIILELAWKAIIVVLTLFLILITGFAIWATLKWFVLYLLAPFL